MPQLRLGKMRHRVTIEAPTETRDANYGGVEVAWNTYVTRWAQVEALSASEQDAAPALASQVTYRVRLHRVAGVTPKMRVVLPGGRVLQIVGVMDPDGEREQTNLLAQELGRDAR